MKFIRIKTCRELMNVDCEQGRKCPARTTRHTIETETDCDAPRRWLYNLVLTAVYAVSIVATTIVFSFLVGYFFGA